MVSVETLRQYTAFDVVYDRQSMSIGILATMKAITRQSRDRIREAIKRMCGHKMKGRVDAQSMVRFELMRRSCLLGCSTVYYEDCMWRERGMDEENRSKAGGEMATRG